MTTAEPGHTMPRGRNNAAPVPAHFTTPAMFAEACHEVIRQVPTGWFTPDLLLDDQKGARQDHSELERVAGAPVGFFHIWREGGAFTVYHFPEDGSGEEVTALGAFDTVALAVGAVLRAINETLASWGLPPLAANRA